MLVVAATPLYGPDSRVGAWLSTHECLKALVAAGHEVAVCSLLGRGDAYEWEGIRVWQGAGHLSGLVAAADVVVSHFGDNGAAHAAARQVGVPSVQIVNAVMTPASRRLLDRATPDLLVCVAESLLESIKPPCESLVVLSPVWPEEHRTTPGDRITLVNLCADKGGKVFEALARRMPDRLFLGVRGGYGRQVEPRLPNVEIIATTRDMRGDVWARTRVLLMPSLHETSGRVGLEAVCSGIPVVCHPTPGLLETQAESGIFVHRDDLDGWIRVLRDLEDPEVWAAASAKASARAASIDSSAQLARFVSAVEALGGVTGSTGRVG